MNFDFNTLIYIYISITSLVLLLSTFRKLSVISWLLATITPALIIFIHEYSNYEVLTSKLNLIYGLVGFGTLLNAFSYSNKMIDIIKLPLSLIIYLSSYFILVASDFITLFVATEVLVICFYAYIISSKKKESSIKILKTFVKTSLLTVVNIIGIAFFVFATNNLEFTSINIVNQEIYAVSVCIFTIVTFSRLLIYPLNTWLTDSIDCLLSKDILLVGFIGMTSLVVSYFVVLNNLIIELDPLYQESLLSFIKISAVLSSLYSAFLSIKEERVIKRVINIFLANLPIVLLTLGNQASVDTVNNSIYYFLTILISFSFSLFLFLSIQKHDKGVLLISNLRGIFKLQPSRVVLIIISIASLCAFPLTAGFTGKYIVMKSLFLNNEFILTSIIVFSSMIAIYSSLMIVSEMFLSKDKSSYDIEIIGNNFRMKALKYLIALSVIIGGIVPCFNLIGVTECMNVKYRLKLKNDRVIGPFEKNQIGELYLKGKIDGTEQCQEFPAGDWAPVKSHKEISELIVGLISGKIKESDLKKRSDTIVNLSLKEKKEKPSEAPKKQFAEFKFNKEETPKVDYEQIEKKYQEKESTKDPVEADIDSTVIIKRPQIENVDKTVIVNPQVLKDEKQAVDENQDEEVEEEVVEEKIDTEEKTEFINIKEHLPAINEVAQESEKELVPEVIEKPKKKKVKKKAEEEDEPEVKKKMKPIVALAFFVILWVVLFPDEKESKELKALSVKMSFPVAAEVLNETKAQTHLSKGITRYKKDTYFNKVKAADHFKKSLSHQFKNNQALGLLILSYSELYEDASNPKKASTTIFKLIEIAKSKALTDINVAMGTAIFYSKIDKHYTAVNVIENYLRLSKPSVKLYATYLDILVQSGDFVKARPVFEKLNSLKTKSKDAYLQMSRFLEMNEEFDDAKKLLILAGQSYPNSVPLLLEYARYLLRDENYKLFESTLKNVRELSAERSPVYMAKFLEYMGILSAIKKDTKAAAIFFKKALAIKESDELRSKLASAELGGTAQVEQLILESKIIDLMKKAKQEIREKNWDKAFSYAIDATDMNPTYIPSQLLLAKIQTSRGYYESAINTLEELRQEFPNNRKVINQLVIAYIEAYKLSDAKKLIAIASRTKFESTYEYASLLGRYYNKSNHLIQTLRWYTESLNRNPLNDEDYFELARVFLKHRKYKKGKSMLNKAINLDPLNVEYRSLYAKVLYELDSAETAIGYLRKELEKHADNPRLLGDIAIYYFKNGQTANFERYKKKIEALNTKDTSFYEFLINSAKLDERYEDVIKYSRELIKVNPGDLETRIVMGEYLLKKGFYPEALKMFESIKTRLKDYPKTNYFIAQTYMGMRNYPKALESADLEIKENKSLHYGYLVKGQVLKKQKKYNVARKNLEKALSINGKSVEALMELGWIKRKQNYLEPARELYLRALKQDSNIPEIHRQLGFIYKDIGQSGLAIESLRLYLNMNPTARDKRQIEALIRQLK